MYGVSQLERFNEFSNRHGKLYMQVMPGVYLFPDGGIATYDDNRGTYDFIEPTTGAEQLARNRDYTSYKLQKVENAFFALKAALVGQGPVFSWPENGLLGESTRDGYQDLLNVQKLVYELREELSKINATIEATDPATIERRKREEVLAQWEESERAKNAMLQAKLAEVSI